MKAPRPLLTALAAAALTLAGCDSFTWNKYDPARPDTPEGMGDAADARAEMSRRCGPLGGAVRQKDDTTGTRTSDWECAERTPR